jgi:hypothetical protein
MIKVITTKQQKIVKLCKKYRVQMLEVFGSATHDDFDVVNSDIDFMLEFTPKCNENYADNYFGLLDALQQLFNHSIDLVVRSSVMNPYFLESIEKDAAALYAA